REGGGRGGGGRTVLFGVIEIDSSRVKGRVAGVGEVAVERLVVLVVAVEMVVLELVGGGASEDAFDEGNLEGVEAKERKEALRRIPEQAILSEVRRMVEEMQAVNKKLEETESAIIEYFKPIDKEAEIIMNMQLEGEERNMRAMSKATVERAMEAQALAEGLANAGNNLESESRHQDQASK
ncbi:hypothetical protein EJ110_NYTH42037, partial [Nymphaea thermarum]